MGLRSRTSHRVIAGSSTVPIQAGHCFNFFEPSLDRRQKKKKRQPGHTIFRDG